MRGRKRKAANSQPEETANFDKAIADADAIGVEIEREQKLMALEKRAIENVAEAERASHRPGSDSPEVQKRIARCYFRTSLGHHERPDAADDHFTAR